MTYNTGMSCEQGFIGGVPEQLFYSADFKGKIKTRSGQVLYTELTPHLVLIEELHKPTDLRGRDFCRFRAGVENKTLSLSVFTKAFQGQVKHHPDMFAAKLLKQSFNFFNKQNTDIKRVLCFWQKPCDTYNQFEAALDFDSNPEPTTKMIKESIKEVWTVKQIAKFGFTNLDVSTLIWSPIPGSEMVFCEFTREPGSLNEASNPEDHRA